MLELDHQTVALWTHSAGVIGASAEVDLQDLRAARPQRVAFGLAKTLLERHFPAYEGVERPWLFPQLLSISKQWLDECLVLHGDLTVGYLLITEVGARAAERVRDSILRVEGSVEPVLLPLLRRFDSYGSTDEVRFLTRKVVMDPPPTKSQLNHVVLDGLKGNSWEEGLAHLLENDSRVKSYVKNERLGFTIPYVHLGRSHEYIPDFLVRLKTEPADQDRTLIIEVSGRLKSPGPRAAKAETARNQWCRAVNNYDEFGRWGYVEVRNPLADAALLDDAIENLYADRPIIGLPA